MISSNVEPSRRPIVKTDPALLYFNQFDHWPKFRAMGDVRAVKIKEVRQAPVNFPSDDGGTWELVPVSEKIKPILVTHSFYTAWKPAPDGYFVYHSATGLNYFMSGSQFEAEFSAVYAPPTEEVPLGRKISELPESIGSDQEVAVRQSVKISQFPDPITPLELNTRTKLQMALILVESGTPEQRTEAAQFLAKTFADWPRS